MPKINKSIHALLTETPLTGKVEWIGIREKKREIMSELTSVAVSSSHGLAGDHYQGNNRNRQVTLIQSEHLQAVASMLGKTGIDPGLTRRNIVIYRF